MFLNDSQDPRASKPAHWLTPSVCACRAERLSAPQDRVNSA